MLFIAMLECDKQSVSHLDIICVLETQLAKPYIASRLMLCHMTKVL